MGWALSGFWPKIILEVLELFEKKEKVSKIQIHRDFKFEYRDQAPKTSKCKHGYVYAIFETQKSFEVSG